LACAKAIPGDSGTVHALLCFGAITSFASLSSERRAVS